MTPCNNCPFKRNMDDGCTQSGFKSGAVEVFEDQILKGNKFICHKVTGTKITTPKETVVNTVYFYSGGVHDNEICKGFVFTLIKDCENNSKPLPDWIRNLINQGKINLSEVLSNDNICDSFNEIERF